MRDKNEEKKEFNIAIDVWGDIACFTNPMCKVERLSYPIMTPSVARNILCSIYYKPPEFYYEIVKIEIMNPIDYINVKKNEVKEKIKYKNQQIYMKPDPDNPSNRERGRTPRNTCYLKNVYYRIHAKIIKRDDWDGKIESLYVQFKRRVEKGQCFRQPYLGLRECVCHFSMPNENKVPNPNINLIVAPLLYDVFDITNNVKLNEKNAKDVIKISFFDAKVINGVCKVPPFNSNKIRRVKNV